MSGSTAEQLLAVCRPYWDGEAEITRRFFARPPSRDDWVFYLGAAVYKELNPAIGYAPPPAEYACNLHYEFATAVDGFRRLDRGVDRHALHRRLTMMTEEFNHYLVLADVLEDLLGRPLAPGDIGQLPQDRALNALRRRHVEAGDPALRAAMMLTEGGGSSTFREGARLSGGEMEQRIARAMQVIYVDEKDHYEDAAERAAEAVRSPDDLSRMTDALVDVGLQRLRMRNEMFREPMTWPEITAFVTARGGRAA